MNDNYDSRFYGPSPINSPIKSNHSTPNKTPIKSISYDRYVPVRNLSENKSEINVISNLFGDENDPKDYLNVSEARKCKEELFLDLKETVKTMPQTTAIMSDLIDSEMLSCTTSSRNFDAEYNPDSVIFDERRTNRPSFRQVLESPNKMNQNPNNRNSFSENTQRILKSPRPRTRKIPMTPYKVLDAPELQDDFYLNLVDWSSQNVLAVGLGTCVYLWNAVSSEIIRLCDVSAENDTITSVSWSEKGNQVAVGTHHGTVQIWDVASETQLQCLEGHTARVGALAWNVDLLASGSRDRNVHLRDTRCAYSSSNSSGTGGNSTATASHRPFKEHRQEVCGLKWSLDKLHLASGGNDNRLVVWTLAGQSGSGLEHPMDVRATAFSPGSTQSVVVNSNNDQKSFKPTTRLSNATANMSAVVSNSIPASSSTNSISALLSSGGLVMPGGVGSATSSSSSMNSAMDFAGTNINGDSAATSNASSSSTGRSSSNTSSSSSSSHNLSPLIVYENHAAAVKAIAWSPHQHGLLASGGGTADRCIKFWNTLTRQAVHSIDTGSQVCNVAWSPHYNELVSTHGYSQNQIVVWNYPSCQPLAKLTGHSCRVLYLALSPDGTNVVTGAGDETLRFWNVFDKPKYNKAYRKQHSNLDFYCGVR